MLQVRPSPVSTPVRLQAEGEGPKSAHEDSRPNFQSFHNIFCVIASRLEAIASTNEPEERVQLLQLAHGRPILSLFLSTCGFGS